MSFAVILGRDYILSANVNISLGAEYKITSITPTDTVTENFINEIMNIEPTDKLDFPLDNISINQEILEENKSRIRNIFARRYLEPERPAQPKVDAEISLSTKDYQPFYFSPRRLSYFEKESVRKFLTTY